MANPEHLEILKQGVEVWNKWRIDKSRIKPNLSGANLGSAQLSQANLSSADLNKAYLRKANLSEADLSGATLIEAILGEADLSGTKLIKANLVGANLSGAIFIEADLSWIYLSQANLANSILRNANLCGALVSEVDFSGADLSGADLFGASLSRANFFGADLSRADLSKANLSEANLNQANLSQADLSEADLSGTYLSGSNLNQVNLSGVDLSGKDLSGADLLGANLSGANLSKTNLRKANLQMASLHAARLINASLDGADLTEACLWETQRAGWSIKSVVCKSIYWDEEKKEKTTYQEGDFERLFAEKTRIRLFYEDGISALEIATLPALIKHLEAAHPGCGLRLVSIREESGGAVVELAIEDLHNHSLENLKLLQVALETEAREKIVYQRQALVERETRLQLEGEIRQLNSVVDKLILRPNIIVNTLGGFMGDTYNISGQAGAVGPESHAHDVTFNQLINQVETTIDLSELAKQLSELRQALNDKRDPSPQVIIALGRIAEAEIAATEKNTPKVIEHLKAAGQWTLEFAKELGKDVAVAAIKQSMGIP